MTLRRKALLIVTIITLSLIAFVYVTSQGVLLGGFTKLEENYSRQNVKRALRALSDDLSSLGTTALDWSAWDDSYAFVEDAKQEFVRVNLVDATFSRLRLNLIMFIHSSGRVVFGRAFDLDREEVVPVPASFQQLLSRDSLLVTHADAKSGLSGVILLPEGPMLIASYPIVTSGNKGPIRGTLIMGRYLGAEEIARLSQEAGLPVIIARLPELQLLPGFGKASSSPPGEESIFVSQLDSRTVTGYSLLRDIYGKAILVLRVDMPRDISRQGQATILYFSLILVGVGSVGLAALLLILDRQVLLRLGHIMGNIRRIGAGGDFSARVTVHGEDELATLADTVNDMLTAIQQSQEKIRESEERYRTLIDNLRVAVVRATPEPHGRIIEMNPAATELTGYSREELLAMKPSQLYVNPEERAKIFEKLASGEIQSAEVEFRKKDGSIITVRLTTRVARDEQGNVLYFDSMSDDITERKRAQRELERLYNKERELREELEEEIKKRTEFTHALVHELKTPLTPVLASSELLLEELKGGPLIRVAKNIYEGASNLNRRIDELLDLARGEVGMLKLHLQMIAPLDIIKEVVSQSLSLATGSNLSLVMELPASLPDILADEDRVRQVLQNLINNAVKYTPAGGVITMRAHQEDAGIVIEAQDTGRGIDEDEQQRLFQPYHRLEGDRERLSGLGLGLALSKWLVELHGGRMWVKSQKGAGSTFSFFLPIDGTKRSKTTEVGKA